MSSQPLSKKEKRIRTIITLILIAAFLISYTFFQKDNCIRMKINGPELTMFFKDFSASLSFEDVVSVELVSDVDTGTAVNGGQTRRYCYGQWTNDLWENYYLYIDADVSDMIVIKTQSDTYVVNYENDETTSQFCEALTEYWRQKKWLDS